MRLVRGNDNKITQNIVDNSFFFLSLSTDCVNDVIVIQRVFSLFSLFN